jgi:hypothetical protein
LVGSVKFVFVTVGITYNGVLGGVAGANAICQAEATASGLPGTYKAWLSDIIGHNSPSTTFTQSVVPYVNTDTTGSQVATGWAGLVASGASNITAIGGVAFTTSYTWDNTQIDGSPFPDKELATDCVDWTSFSFGPPPESILVGVHGTPGQVGGPEPRGDTECTVPESLTCFQQ